MCWATLAANYNSNATYCPPWTARVPDFNPNRPYGIQRSDHQFWTQLPVCPGHPAAHPESACRGAYLSDADRGRGHTGSHAAGQARSEEHTSELQSLMRISYAVFCLQQKKYLIYKIKY